MKLKTLLFFLILTFPRYFNAQYLWQINKDTVVSWYYEDGDEFNDNVLNTEKWKYWFGWSRSISSQKEQQYYTDGKNHQLENGNLNLFAVKETVNERIVDWMDDTASIYENDKIAVPNKRNFNYTAGMIQSHKSYKYGYFEIKFKIPRQGGYWPAFWLYGGTPNEEIDWMELKTEKKNAIHVGRHSQKREENKIRDVFRKKWWGNWVYFKGDLSEGWNIVSGEWTPNYLKYYLNGECIAYSKIAMNIEKVLCANIAVPSKNGSFNPAPDTSIIKSGDFSIDYIRIWGDKKLNDKPAINFSTPITTKPISNSKLKSKTKFLYGPKSIHQQEGVIVSLFPQTPTNYLITLTGKEIPLNSSIELKNETGQVVYSATIIYGENSIDLINYAGTEFILTINCLNKTIKHQLFKPLVMNR